MLWTSIRSVMRKYSSFFFLWPPFFLFWNTNLAAVMSCENALYNNWSKGSRVFPWQRFPYYRGVNNLKCQLSPCSNSPLLVADILNDKIFTILTSFARLVNVNSFDFSSFIFVKSLSSNKLTNFNVRTRSRPSHSTSVSFSVDSRNNQGHSTTVFSQML